MDILIQEIIMKIDNYCMLVNLNVLLHYILSVEACS